MNKKELLHIGTFHKPLGISGEIKIIMHTINYQSFKSLNPFLNFRGDHSWNFSYLKVVNDQLVGKLENCNNRDCAENLRGKKIFTIKMNLPKTKIDQYYVIDLIDCKVRNKKDFFLGNIIDIKNFGAGDLIYIKNKKGKKFFIPMNKENIVKIDTSKKLVIVNPIKGIID